MGTSGVFGYIIGRKKRMMKVHYDANLLWQILVREIYVLMKHYKTKEDLQAAFKSIKATKKPPTLSDIAKCKCFTELDSLHSKEPEWLTLLWFCQCSFINMLESGYILNESEEHGYIFMLDFNKGTARFYSKSNEGKIQEFQKASIEEIMGFNEMPTKTYIEIVTEMRERFSVYYGTMTKIQEEIEKLKRVKENVMQQGAINIEERINALLSDFEFEKKQLNANAKVFYYRLQALDLIEEPKKIVKK